MKWIHFSDIHLSSNITGTDTRLLQKELTDYLHDITRSVDLLLLSGDYRYCGHPSTPETACEWIHRIGSAVGVTEFSKQVFLVPGNHDITRSAARDSIINEIKNNYSASLGRFPNDTLAHLLDGFDYYNLLYKEILGKDYLRETLTMNNPHRLKDCGDFSLLLLNTALLSNRDEERGKLLVGTDYIAALEPPPNKPLVIMGHHGLEVFPAEERKKLKQIFKSFGAVLYLCGDAHELYEEYIDEGFYQITDGCLRYEGGNVDIAFTAGETIGSGISITAHEWRNGNWAIASHFGHQGTFSTRTLKSGAAWQQVVEPRLRDHILKAIHSFEQMDIPIHTPQILLILLSYPGSVLYRVLNEYHTKSGLLYGDYLVKWCEDRNFHYKQQGYSFHREFDINSLLEIEQAEILRINKGFSYIPENFLVYAVLNGKSRTMQRIYAQNPSVFEDIKRKILCDVTPL